MPPQLAPPGLCVPGRRGRTESCGCLGLGGEGRQRRKKGDPKALGWGSGAWGPELGHGGEVPRAVGRDTAGVGWEPRYWRRGLPEWVRQAPASGLVPRALLGVQTRVAGGLGSVGRKAGRTSLCGLGDPAPYPAPGVPLDWVVSGLSPMCLGPPALTRLTRGRTRRGRLGALAVGPLGLVSIRAGAGVQGALSVRMHALRVASSARFLWCDSPPSLGLPFWYLLCGETGFRLRTGYPARWGRPGTQPCALPRLEASRAGRTTAVVRSITTLGEPHRGRSRSEMLGRVQPSGEVSSPPQRGCRVPVPFSWVSSGLREAEGRRESPSFSSLSAPGAPPLASRPRPPTGVLLSSVAAGPRLTDELLEVSDTAP